MSYKRIEEHNEENMAGLAKSYREVIALLGENPDREGLKKTPERIAKAMQFITHGSKLDAKKLGLLIKEFILDNLDHKNLNVDVDFLKDKMCSTEIVAMEIWCQLQPHLPQSVQLHCIKLYETPRIYVEYFGD